MAETERKKKRGRPSSKTEQKKVLSVRISDDEWKMLDYVSEKMHLSRSRLVRLFIHYWYDETVKKKR